jgi:hypothetical protein
MVAVALATSSASQAARSARLRRLWRSASRLRTRAISSTLSTGLVRKSCAPSDSAWWRTSLSVSAVTITMATSRRSRHGLQAADEFEAVHHRHHVIEQDQVRLVAGAPIQRHQSHRKSTAPGHPRFFAAGGETGSGWCCCHRPPVAKPWSHFLANCVRPAMNSMQCWDSAQQSREPARRSAVPSPDGEAGLEAGRRCRPGARHPTLRASPRSSWASSLAGTSAHALAARPLRPGAAATPPGSPPTPPGFGRYPRGSSPKISSRRVQGRWGSVRSWSVQVRLPAAFRERQTNPGTAGGRRIRRAVEGGGKLRRRRPVWTGSRPCRRPGSARDRPASALAVMAITGRWRPLAGFGGANRAGRGKAVHFRHLAIHQDQLVATAGGGGHGLGTGGDDIDGIVEALQHVHRDAADSPHCPRPAARAAPCRGRGSSAPMASTSSARRARGGRLRRPVRPPARDRGRTGARARPGRARSG